MYKEPPKGEPTKIEDNNFVSIIWVHYAMDRFRSELARASLYSLIETTRNTPCEIIVVDNGGSWQDSKYFLELAHKKEIQHYIRNAENLHFSYARNQALLLAGGKYIAISDNDIIFDQRWLNLCLSMLEQFPNKKFIASIIYYPYTSARLDKRYHRGNIHGKHEYQLNERAGANLMVMRKEVFEEMGLFSLHKIAGAKFVDNLVRAGYVTILPPEKYRYMAKDCGLRRGYKPRDEVLFCKTLTDGSKKYYDRYYFVGDTNGIRRPPSNKSSCQGDDEVNESS